MCARRAEGHTVSHPGTAGLDGAGDQLQGRMTASQASREPEGTEGLYGLHDNVLPVQVEDVYAEEHEEGMDGGARRQEEPLALGKAAAAQEPHHARPRTVGAPHASGHLAASRKILHPQQLATHCARVSYMVIAAGARMTRNSVGKMHSTSGKVIFTGA